MISLIPLALLIGATSTTAVDLIPAPNFRIDPVIDGAVLGAAGGFALLAEAIISTGEIKPQTPGDPGILLSIDRPTALASSAEPSGKILSDLSVGVAIGFSLIDIVRAELEDRPEGALGHGLIYLESAAINVALGDLVKIAVRRPRPRAYIAIREGTPLDATDLSLSFYSLHTALTAGLGATATTLAFQRNPDGLEGWVLLGATVGLSTFVGIQRVRDRAHFATDVIAGAIAGAGIGVLVPTLHRYALERRLMISPVGPDGPGLSLLGTF